MATHRFRVYPVAAAVCLALGFVCAAGVAAADEPSAPGAGFADPTAVLPEGGAAQLADRVYIAPFARLTAGGGHHITIGREANVQDNAVLEASQHDIVLGDRAIVAHGAVVKSTQPASIAADTQRPEARNPGVEAIERYMAKHPKRYSWGGVPSFVGFNALVDGAVVQDGSMVMHMGMISPGLTLHSGLKVLAGKRIGTQQEADDPALGKVEVLTEADLDFMADVVEVNTDLAEGYAKLEKERPDFVRGIGYDPGTVDGNRQRDLPLVGGARTQQADTGKFKYRIIGDVRIQGVEGLRDRVSLRADEGPTFVIGGGGKFRGGNTLHALKRTGIVAGNRVTLEPKAIVHGGSGTHLKGGTWTEIGDGTVIGAGSVVFRSKLGNGVQIGAFSLVTDSVIPDGTVIPAGEVWSGGKKLYNVEW